MRLALYQRFASRFAMAHSHDLPSLAKIADALDGDVRNGEVLAPGPGHSGADRSLSVKPEQDAPDGFLVHSFSGDDPADCRRYVREKLGLPEPKATNGKRHGSGTAWTPVAEYIYQTGAGEPYLRVRKYLDGDGKKQYPQDHWDGRKWETGKPKGAKMPYRLPQLIAAPLSTAVFFCEGEKDCDSLAKLSFAATTQSEGAKAPWDSALTPHFRDRHVVILPDADAPGRKHAIKVAKALYGVAASIRIIDLFPDLSNGRDVSDWLGSDTSGAKLAKLVKEAPLWEPSADGDSVGKSDASDDLIAELAALDRLQYACRRQDAAKQLGIRVADLDEIVAQARSEIIEPDYPTDWQVERWPEPVPTADLLDDLSLSYARHVILPEYGAAAMALWTLHAWAFDAAYCSPFLMFVSPEPRCGKSTAMSLLYRTGPRTVLASNISPAAIFRYIEHQRPCLLLDEAETYQSEEARGILNSGHTRDTAYVIRCDGDDNEPKRFSTWAPKAVASIGKLAATLRDRAIIMHMKRKKRTEGVAKLRNRDTDDFRTLREKAKRWAADNVEALKRATPSLPANLNDRATDNWEPLVAIADLATGDWPAKARVAASKLSADADPETIGTQLLATIKAVFDARRIDRITSRDLAEALAENEDSPWASYGKTGRPITQRQIASLLEHYGVRPGTIRIGADANRRGYLLPWLTDAFETYLDAGPGSPDQSATPPQRPSNKATLHSRSATGPFTVADRGAQKPNNDAACGVVADRDPRAQEHEDRALNTETPDPCAPTIAPTSDAPADQACRWCGRPVDGSEQLCAISGNSYWLHPGCQQPFLIELGGAQ